ncbi:TIGR01459 family HAD-type hydrolase [Aerophototrophica crusticola]
MTLPIHVGLSQVADRYDGFILDLWGVVHDGVAPYPGVPECLAALKARGKKICLLSNAPRRVAAAKAKLDGMGLDAGLYDFLYTSGEASFEALRDPPDAWHAALGPRLFHIGPPRDNDVYDSLPGRVRVDTPDQADFVVNTGIDDFDETLADYEPVLQACAARRLPMLCANPDLVVVVGTKMVICAGELARRYEELGGSVAWHGKPFPSVYRRCFQLLGGWTRRGCWRWGTACAPTWPGPMPPASTACWSPGASTGKNWAPDGARPPTRAPWRGCWKPPHSAPPASSRPWSGKDGGRHRDSNTSSARSNTGE